MSGRRSRSIDVSPFREIMDQALTAYGEDHMYAVLMARQASTIQNKRDVWQLRLELRESSKRARRECASAEPFTCDTSSPCGTGSCRFASGDLVLLEVPHVPGRELRPQENTHGPTFSVESAVRPLQEQRHS